MVGFWDAVNATTDAVKKCSPDVTPVANACRSSYNLGLSALKRAETPVTNACHTTYNLGCSAVKGGVEKTKVYIPSPDTQEKMMWYAQHPLTREVSKLFIPAQGYNIIGVALKTISGAYPNQSDKKYEQLMEDVIMLRANHEKLHAELEQLKGSGTNNGVSIPHSLETTVTRKPEEVLRIFTMKGFKINNVLEEQVVPIRGHFDIEP